jgi:hypothetical protein
MYGGLLSELVSNPGLVLSDLVGSLTMLVSLTIESKNPPREPKDSMSLALALIGRTSVREGVT